MSHNELERLRRAYRIVDNALCHVINRVSTERRDDEHGHIFLVGSTAREWANYELDGTATERARNRSNVPTRDDLLEAVSMLTCPYLTHDGTCDRGCYSEPACMTDAPVEGWDGVVERAANALPGTEQCVCDHGEIHDEPSLTEEP